MGFSRSWRIKSYSSFSKSSSSKKPAVSRREQRRHKHESSKNEPASPIVSCLGQIKSCKSAPPPPPLPAARRGLHFLPATTSSAAGKSKSEVKVEEMDPPLPVEKKKLKPCFAKSLWTRRCRDRADLAELKLCRPARLTEVEPAAKSGVVG